MSTRAIGSALGAHQETVVNDLKQVNGFRSPAPDAPSLPEKVTGLDGRDRPRKATAPEPTPEQRGR